MSLGPLGGMPSVAGGNPRTLYPDAYDTEQAKSFATVVSDEIESYRAKKGGVRGGKSPRGLLANLLDDPYSEASINQRIWHTFLTEPSLIDSCCERLAISRREYVHSCLDLLHPPNWEALFWMGAWLDQLAETLLTADTSVRERVEAKAHAQTAMRAKMASLGGKGRSEKLYAHPKQWVKDHWCNKGEQEYDGNKSKFARDYVSLVKEQFGRDITQTTITNSWLKGM